MKKIVLSFTLLLVFFTGCSQKEITPVEEPKVIAEEKPTYVEQKEDEDLLIRKKIVENAIKYLNKDDGHDCSGFVDLVNTQSGQAFYNSDELYKHFDNTNRSKAIFNLMKTDKKLVTTILPKVGDLVFFEDTLHNTKRKVGSLNITHVGIVTKVDSDATVHFIHNIQGKNRVDQLNTKYSDYQVLSGKNVNSYLKRCPKNRNKKECLSSFFFSSYAAPIQNEHIELSKK